MLLLALTLTFGCLMNRMFVARMYVEPAQTDSGQRQKLSSEEVGALVVAVDRVAAHHRMSRDVSLADYVSRLDNARLLRRYFSDSGPIFSNPDRYPDVRLSVWLESDSSFLQVIISDRDHAKETDFTRNLREDLNRALSAIVGESRIRLEMLDLPEPWS